MPFTPTHALAAVPLARIRALTPSALAIGCMVPDLPMFVRDTPSYETTHSWSWGPVSCIPYGLLAFALFRLCRGPAIGFLPEGSRRRLGTHAAHDLKMSASAWSSVVISIALGACTHILWDGLTHANRFGSVLLPALATPWLTAWGHPLAGYKLLQYGSSVIGLPVLGIVIARWYARQSSDGEHHVEAASTVRRLLALTLLFGAPLVVSALVWTGTPRPAHDLAELIAYFIVTRTIAAYLLGVVLLTLPQQLLSMKNVVSVRSD